MYCPVYGCNSDCKTTSEIRFFQFPAGKSADQQCRRKAWIEFCKRKSFEPSSYTRICSLHFAEDVYEPGMSPAFLERLQGKETFRNQLKKDALPSLNKPTVDVNKVSKKRSHSERRQKKGNFVTNFIEIVSFNDFCSTRHKLIFCLLIVMNCRASLTCWNLKFLLVPTKNMYMINNKMMLLVVQLTRLTVLKHSTHCLVHRIRLSIVETKSTQTAIKTYTRSVKTQTIADSTSTFLPVKPMTQSVETETSVYTTHTVVQNVPVQSLRNCVNSEDNTGEGDRGS